jgi:hypothetical protein
MAIEEQRKNSGARGRSENLKPFPPGVSGNPGGRPKGRSITAIMRAKLDDTALAGEPCPEGRTVAETLVEAIFVHAVKHGNAALTREILDRLEGKPQESQPVSLASLARELAERERRSRERSGSGPIEPRLEG